MCLTGGYKFSLAMDPQAEEFGNLRISASSEERVVGTLERVVALHSSGTLNSSFVFGTRLSQAVSQTGDDGGVPNGSKVGLVAVEDPELLKRSRNSMIQVFIHQITSGQAEQKRRPAPAAPEHRFLANGISRVKKNHFPR